MAYLHCHHCNWGQDDFWSKDGYNPLRPDRMSWLAELLLEKKYRTEKQVVDGLRITSYVVDPDGGVIVDGKEFVAAQLEAIAKTIRHMEVRTDEEWSKMGHNFKCPNCGKLDGMDID